MGWILSQPVIVAFAVLGGLASLVAMVVRARALARPEWVDRLTRLAYLLMGISVILFIVSGFFKSANSAL